MMAASAHSKMAARGGERTRGRMAGAGRPRRPSRPGTCTSCERRPMPEHMTLAAWRSLLEARGHPIRQTESGFTVWPGPDAIVTVAVEPDATFYPHNRQRFFLCE